MGLQSRRCSSHSCSSRLKRCSFEHEGTQALLTSDCGSDTYSSMAYHAHRFWTVLLFAAAPFLDENAIEQAPSRLPRVDKLVILCGRIIAT